MIQAFIVYFSLMSLMLFLALKGKFVFIQDSFNLRKNNNYIIISIISIFIFSIVIGLRYYVGGDYVGYLDDFNYFNLGISYFNTRYELGYYTLMVILKFLKLAYPFLFIAISFLQILFIYKWASNYKFLLPWIIYFYFTTLYLFESMNLMRQAIAFSLLLYSTIYITKSEKLKFAFTVIFAFIFHKSAIFFLPFYFFVNKDWIKNKYIQITLLLASFYFAEFLFETFFQKIEVIAILLNYEHYSKLTSDLFLEVDVQGMGLGIYFILTIDMLILLYSNKLKNMFKENSFNIYYNMFFIGAIFSSVTSKSNSIVLDRFLFYFDSFRFVVLSFLCYYLVVLSKSKINYIIGILVVIAFLFWFIIAITKGAAWSSPFQFIFQDFVPNR